MSKGLGSPPLSIGSAGGTLETSMGVMNTEVTQGGELESIKRSGMFGKLLLVSRESSNSVRESIRAGNNTLSYRSTTASIQAASFTSRTSKQEGAPPQQASWVAIAFVMVAEVVGAGVLTLSQKYAELGYVIASLLIVLLFFLLVGTSHLMVEVRKVFPGIVAISDAADYTFGRTCSWIAHVLLIINLIFILGDYLLLIGKSLGSTLYNFHLCSPAWTAISAAVVAPILGTLRTLHSTTLLCVFSVLTIAVSVVIVLIALIVQGRPKGIQSPVIAEDLTFLQFFQSFSAIYFTFSGQFMFYELMSEMKDFTEFTKTFIIAGPFQVTVYLIVGCVGYYYRGVEASGYFLDNLGFGWEYRLASALLCFHMVVGFVILGNVLSRILHVSMSSYVNDLGWRGRLEWLGCTCSVVVLSYVISNLIPFFDLLTSLIGGLFLPILCLCFPVLIYMKMRFMVEKPLKAWEWLLYVSLLALGVVIIVVSTMGTVKALISNWSTFGAPFSCHCQEVWNTCECSPQRMILSGFNCTKT